MSAQVLLNVPDHLEPVIRAANIEDKLSQALLLAQRSACLPAIARALEVHLEEYGAEVSALRVTLEFNSVDDETNGNGKGGQ